MTTIAIVANGILHRSYLTKIRKAKFIIGVDYGALWLIKHHIVPDCALGDFDSVTKRELALLKKTVPKVKTFPSKKSATDIELAVNYAIRLRPEEVLILGGIGTRLDHTLAAVNLLGKLLAAGIRGRILDERNEILLVDGRYRVSKTEPYRYISLLPYTQQTIVSLSGFAYPLSRGRLLRGTSRGISNEIIAETATIEVHEGLALVIKSRD